MAKKKKKSIYKITHRPEPPLTPKEKARRLEILLEEYLEGNFKTFLWRHYKRYWYELVYSKTLPKWRKTDREAKTAVRWLLRKVEYPSHVVKVANIMYTLEKHFDWRVTKKNMLIAYTIWDYLEETEIAPYMNKKYTKSLTQKIRTLDFFKCTPKQALKEQKARGFIDVIDFEDYDSTKHHVYSTVDRDLIYPQNFGLSHIDSKDGLDNIYIGQGLYGVKGYTQARVNEKVLHRN